MHPSYQTYPLGHIGSNSTLHSCSSFCILCTVCNPPHICRLWWEAGGLPGTSWPLHRLPIAPCLHAPCPTCPRWHYPHTPTPSLALPPSPHPPPTTHSAPRHTGIYLPHCMLPHAPLRTLAAAALAAPTVAAHASFYARTTALAAGNGCDTAAVATAGGRAFRLSDRHQTILALPVRVRTSTTMVDTVADVLLVDA